MPQSLLPESWDVPPAFHHRLGARPGRQRLMQHDGHLLLLLHQAPQPTDPDRAARFFWRKPDGSWRSHPEAGGDAVLRRHLQEYQDVIERLEEIEHRTHDAADYFRIARGIAPVRRAANHMYAVLQEAREQAPDDRNLILLRDTAGALDRAAELLKTDAQNGLDYAIAKQSEEQARAANAMAMSAHRLNSLAALFFPIATFAAIFGMNLVHGFEERFSPWLFWIVLGVGVAIGLAVRGAILRTPTPAR